MLERETFTVEEAAAILGIGRGLAYELVRADQIPHIRLGRRIVVPKGPLYRLLDEWAGGEGLVDAAR